MISSSEKPREESAQPTKHDWKEIAKNGPSTNEDFLFLGLSVVAKNATTALRTAYKMDDDEISRKDSRIASNLKQAFLKKDAGHYFMMGLEMGLHLNEGVADGTEVLTFLSDVFRGEVKDQFGLDAALSDRIKAAEDMAKHHKLLTDSLEVKADSSFADALSKARRRAAKGERDAP